jgi:hypothetical protein
MTSVAEALLQLNTQEDVKWTSRRPGARRCTAEMGASAVEVSADTEMRWTDGEH